VLISSVRVLQSDSSQLYCMPNAELFLVPQHLPHREHTQYTTISLVRAVPHREEECDSLTPTLPYISRCNYKYLSLTS